MIQNTAANQRHVVVAGGGFAGLGAAGPHTGYLSIRMGQAAAEHVAASLGRGRPAARTLPYVLDVRMLDGSSAGLFLASWGTRKLRNAAMLLPRSVAHYLKAFQERYLVWRLHTGRMNLP